MRKLEPSLSLTTNERSMTESNVSALGVNDAASLHTNNALQKRERKNQYNVLFFSLCFHVPKYSENAQSDLVR